jgi:SAM-dependent methyltransferase
VDLVSLAHEVPFPPETFDTVLSASMLEHDPYWERSIKKMVETLKPDGLLGISWGAARNTPHEFATAPDGEFHALKAGLVLSLLKNLDIYIHEFQYERSITEQVKDDPSFTVHRLEDPEYGLGTVVLVAFKDKKYATGEQLINPLQEWDVP